MKAWQQITNSQRISTVIVCSAWTDIPHEHYHETVWDMARLQTRDFYGASVCDRYGSVCLLLVCLKCQHSLLRWLDDDVDFVRVLPFDLSKAFDTFAKVLFCEKLKSTNLNPSTELSASLANANRGSFWMETLLIMLISTDGYLWAQSLGHFYSLWWSTI